MSLPPYLEKLDSQVPAIQVLQALGWEYLSREEARDLRDGRLDRTVLTGVLRPWLADNNSIESRGRRVSFSAANITEGIRRLTEVPFDGLVRTNEQVYNLLTLGTSLDQEIDGDRKGRQLHFIDWSDWSRNRFHVTDEFVVERARSHETRRPDLVLFINGIPVVVIECKRRDNDGPTGKKQLEIAIDQLLGYQKSDEIPHLFPFVQLLLATSVNECLYGTVGTPRKFWAVWKEERLREQAVHAAANTRLPPHVEAKLFAPLDRKHAAGYSEARRWFDELWNEGDRLPTTQDRTLWALLRPERLIEFVRDGVVFDAGVRKVARYQQWFAVREALARVRPLRSGKRSGGVVWHTTGSGKSITMVMLAKAIALDPGIPNARVVVVTDRVDLDDQISRTFGACGVPVDRARTGEHLVRLIKEDRATVITTVIDKFETVLDRHSAQDDNPNLFVLVDESHRSNYGATAAKMRRVFPNGCYLGFTGTPLQKHEKNTADRFGGFIHNYTMRQAVEDEAVVPLIYEGRHAQLEQNQRSLDAWFERITQGLNEKQKADLKRKLARREVLNKAEQRLYLIAFDISQHYERLFQGTGLKAQFAADSRTSAVRYRKFFEQIGTVSCEVIMSNPDMRGADEDEEEDKQLVAEFWKEMMERFGSEKAYNDDIKASFAREDGVELLIVVHKLLTGFDEPRNTVLYVDKRLKEHNVLQAIARVNRLYPGKDHGFVIDYRGVLGDLDEAMRTYDALAGFDPADLDVGGAIVDVSEVLAQLPQHHSDVWEVFKQISKRRDAEALERHLEPEDRRETFYEALRTFRRTMAAAVATERFYLEVTPERAQTYKLDLKYFESLRRSVQSRYAEVVDYRPYERQLRGILDSHLLAPELTVVTPAVSIFDKEAFDHEVEERKKPASKADTIANRLKRTIREKMEEDPAFYAKFAALVQQAIDDYRADRISDLEYLATVKSHLETVRRGHASDLPPELEGATHEEARAYYGVVGEVLAEQHRPLAAGFALEIERRLDALKIVDWPRNTDVLKRMEDAVDDFLFDVNREHGLKMTTEQIDDVLKRTMAIARRLAGA